MALLEPHLDDLEMTRTVQLLGGRRMFARTLHSRLDTHDLLKVGLPAKVLDHLVREVDLLRGDPTCLERAVGISTRTYQRRKKDDADKPLSREQSGRVWKFAEVLARVSTMLGSQEEAEQWLERPAVGLDQRRPMDLLSTPAGLEMLETFLTRLEYGVYT